VKVNHYLIRGVSGLFYFRLRVPPDVYQHIGRRVFKRATGTRDPHAAVLIASDWAARYCRVFEMLRGGKMGDKSKDEILAALHENHASWSKAGL